MTCLFTSTGIGFFVRLVAWHWAMLPATLAKSASSDAKNTASECKTQENEFYLNYADWVNLRLIGVNEAAQWV